jgi:hypothetical protein
MKKAEIITKLKAMYATLPESCDECPQLKDCNLCQGDHCLILYAQEGIGSILESCLSWDEFNSLQSTEVK